MLANVVAATLLSDLKIKKASFFLQRPQFANTAKSKAKTSLEGEYIDDSDDFY